MCRLLKRIHRHHHLLSPTSSHAAVASTDPSPSPSPQIHCHHCLIFIFPIHNHKDHNPLATIDDISDKHEQQVASAMAAVDKVVNKVVSFPSTRRSLPPLPLLPDLNHLSPLSTAADVEVKQKVRNRFLTCNKKVGVIGFKCRCGETFYGIHRYSEKHDCEFDFKRLRKEVIARANPLVKGDKVDPV